jgi:hypothetical protein
VICTGTPTVDLGAVPPPSADSSSQRHREYPQDRLEGGRMVVLALRARTSAEAPRTSTRRVAREMRD